ncbi:MAG: DUF6596 domain-containing protein [Nostocoides sp.]
MTDADEVLARTMREEWGRIVALLLAQFRRLDLVEDAAAEAFAAAAERWPSSGAPDKPAAWLFTTARRRILDRLRAESMAARRMPLLLNESERREEFQSVRADPGGLVHDDLLRLVLLCAHPALAPESACALSLRFVLGVTTADIARLFLVSESTMAARITRAKKKIVAAGIPYAVPDASAVPSRLEVVAQTAYLAFTTGYAPGSGPDLLRADLAGEAIRLVRVARALQSSAALDQLLALTLLHHSRRDARLSGDGRLVLLPDQDRARWHRDEIAEAVQILSGTAVSMSGALPTGLALDYHLQALIAAEHALAPTAADTRWDRIVTTYAALEEINPSPSVRLARAVAVAEVDGPHAGLALLRDVGIDGHRLPAVRAELALRAGDREGARTAYEIAVGACGNEVERAHLQGRLAELVGGQEPGR